MKMIKIIVISVLALSLVGCEKKSGNEDFEQEDVSEVFETSEEMTSEPVLLRDEESEISTELDDWADLYEEVQVSETTTVEEEGLTQDSDIGVGYLSFGDYTTGSLGSMTSTGGSSVEVDSHEHDYVLVETDDSGSCTKGAKRYYECDCGETKTEVDSPVGHTFTDNVIEATCKTEGYTERTCSRCGYSYKVDKKPLKEHTLKTETIQEPTCLIEGITKTYCTVCGEVTGYANLAALGHDLKLISEDPKCKSGAVETYQCTRCKAKQTKGLSGAHTWGAWTETTKATCSKKGVQTRTCSVCKATETKEIAMIAHTEGNWTIEEESTCTSKGERVKYCTVCKEVIKRENLALADHSTGDWIIDYASTCTSEGKRHKYCSKCKKNVEVEIIPKKDHIGEWITVIPATCLSEGVREYVCSSCGESVKTGVIIKKPHSLMQTSFTPATCEEEGCVLFTCSVCGAEERSVVAPEGHDPDSNGKCRKCGKIVTK